MLWIDTETTGIDGARLVELSYKKDDGPIVTLRCKPPFPIEVGASAVNGIGNWEVKDLPLFKDMPEYQAIKDMVEEEGQVIVAHNANFDVGVLAREGITAHSFFDTKEAAKAKWPQAEKHNLQYLRYYLDIRIDGVAHTSNADVAVLYELWKKLNGDGGDLPRTGFEE